MSEGSGVDGSHCVSGVCDLCGDSCDANTQELNVLSCTFKNCEDLPYHQDCLEKYLKSIRLERNRKTGFKCPRGCGKGTSHKEPCPGKIDKSHPIHPRNEEQKKKKKSKMPEVMLQPPPRNVKVKEDKKVEKGPAAKAAAVAADKAKPAKPAPAGGLKAAAASSSAAKPAAAKPPPPPDPRTKLAEALAAARRELAAGKSAAKEQQQQQQPLAPAAPEYKTLDVYYRESAASSSSLSSMSSSTAPVANAWAKPPAAPAAAAAAGAGPSERGRQQHKPEPGKQQQQQQQHLHSAGPSRTQSPAGSSSSAAGGAGLHVQPPPPPPPPPLHHGPLQHSDAHSLHSHQLLGSSSSLLSQQSSTSGIGGSSASFHAAANSAAGAAGAAAAAAVGPNGQPQLPVGAEYVAEEEHVPLTKAQKKNLKRAEKKKKGTFAETGCNAGTEGDAAAGDVDLLAGSSTTAAASAAGGSGSGGGSSSGGGNGMRLGRQASTGAGSAAGGVGAGSSRGNTEDDESTATMYELALQALLAHKTLELVASLQRLGFSEWQAAAAVQRHGSDLEDAVAWLLDGGAPNPAAAAAISSGCVADVSITEELGLMEALAAAVSALPKSQVYQAVADAGGDLDAAAATCLQQSVLAAAGVSKEVDYSAMVDGNTGAAEEATAVQQQQQQPPLQPPGFDGLLANGMHAAGSTGGCGNYGGGLGMFSDLSNDVPAASGHTFAAWLRNPTSHASSSAAAAAAAITEAEQQPSTSSPFSLPSPVDSQAAAAAGSSLTFLPTTSSMAAGAGVGSSIWASADANADAGSSWALDSSGVPSTAGLFGSSGLGLQNTLGSLGYGGYDDGSSSNFATPGLGFLSSLQQQPQQSLSAADPVLESFGSGAAAAAAAAATASKHPDELFYLGSSDGLMAAAAPAAPAAPVAPALQESRLFSSYGWRQPLFSDAQQQQGQQQGQQPAGVPAAAGAAGDADDTDLDGLMATLMCH